MQLKLFYYSTPNQFKSMHFHLLQNNDANNKNKHSNAKIKSGT